MHGFRGIYIPDSAKYEEFIQSCDSHNDNSKYEWQRTEIGDRHITMGSSISLNWDNTEGECTLAYVLIPKTYLSEDWYSVGCLNKGWNEK